MPFDAIVEQPFIELDFVTFFHILLCPHHSSLPSNDIDSHLLLTRRFVVLKTSTFFVFMLFLILLVDAKRK